MQVFSFLLSLPLPLFLPPTPSRPRPPPKRRLRQPLHSVPPPAQIHHRHARDLAHAPAEVPVARRHDVAAVRLGPLAEAVVGVRPPVVAGQPLQPGVLGDAQRDPVPGTELLQLGDHALGDARDALGVQAVHHALHEVDLVLDRVVDEVCVDEDVVRGAEALVPAEEEGGGRCLDVADLGFLWLLLVLRGTGVCGEFFFFWGGGGCEGGEVK